MTREECKKQLVNKLDEDIIDKIYDDFESRVCGNCKYFNKFGRCTNGVIQNTESSNNIHEDVSNFGCNKFERKGE